MTTEDRITNLDILRVMAMLMVVVDHYLQKFGNEVCSQLGFFLGGSGICIFLALSAYLYGLKWRKSGKIRFELKHFLLNRFSRILLPMWLVLLFIIPLDHSITHSLDIVTLVLNFLGLGWFRPLASAGHLWYITMQCILYVFIYIISSFNTLKINKCFWLVSFAVAFCIYIVFPGVFAPISHSCAPYVLLFSTLIFYEGDSLKSHIGKHPRLITIPTMLLTLSMLIVCLVPQLHGLLTFQQFMFCSWTLGFLYFLLYISMSKDKKISKLILFFSEISYEIYLVHTPILVFLCLFINNEFLLFFLFLIFTVLFAMLLSSFNKKRDFVRLL